MTSLFRRCLALCLGCALVFSATVPAFAFTRAVTVWEFFVEYYGAILDDAPRATEYIELYYTNVEEATPLYDALQRAVYYDMIPNRQVNIELSRPMSVNSFLRIVERDFGLDLDFEDDVVPLTSLDLAASLSELQDLEPLSRIRSDTNGFTASEQFPILLDVYEKLKTRHIEGDSISDEALVRWAIEGMVEVMDDEFSAYFPPSENDVFREHLEGEFEGIGAYVDMEEPGKFVIISPIPGTPADRAGLAPGDIIRAIDDEPITESTTTDEAIARIKWPAWTRVKLLIERDGEMLTVSVERAKIEIPFVEYERLDSGADYIRITTFWDRVAQEFATAMQNVRENETGSRVIIDLRNNPGGSLDAVERMLSDFVVPAGEPTVLVRSREDEEIAVSSGENRPLLYDREVVILINEWSASASEIFALVVRDYLPHALIIGTQSYGKGSVQNYFPYRDGSALKFTTAKWFSAKSKDGIDGEGVAPDVILDPEEYDDQAILEYAQSVEMDK